MAKYKFQPWHLIILGVAIFLLFEMNLTTFLGSTYDLVDSETNQSFACTSTMDCYNLLTITGSDQGPPALACSSEGICVFSECIDGDVNQISCPGGSTVTVSECNDGLWENINSATCPATECSKNSDCVMQSDTDCDGELEAVQTTCTNYKCTSAPANTCTKAELFIGQYKIWLISGILIILGVAGFLWAAPRKMKLF